MLLHLHKIKFNWKSIFLSSVVLLPMEVAAQQQSKTLAEAAQEDKPYSSIEEVLLKGSGSPVEATALDLWATPVDLVPTQVDF